MDKSLNPSRLIRFEETLDALVTHLGKAEILNTGYDLILEIGAVHEWGEMTIKYMLDRYHDKVITHITAESQIRMETIAALNRRVD